ncbi:MAG TPA: hypothetical protein DCY59_06010 [Micrococcaceae bacterium]|nr:hypothetical protein [Micrococcaceae bacterium]
MSDVVPRSKGYSRHRDLRAAERDALADGTLVELEDGLRFVQRNEVTVQLLAAVDTLPPRLKTLVVRHYFEFVSFTALAQERGVTKGRVPQLHRSAMEHFRKRIALD